MKRKILSIALCLSLAATAITACAKDSEDEEDVSDDQTIESVESEDVDADETEPEEAETEETEAEIADFSIVSLSPACTEMIFAIGGGDKVVGVTSYDDYPADVFEITQVGDTMAPDTELIASLEPSVVFATSYLSEDTLAELESLGIEVVIVEEAADFDGVFENIQLVADLIGMSDEGADLVSSLEADLADVTADEMTDVSVYYVVGYGEYGDFTAGAGTFVDSIITTAGAVNAGAAADGWFISQEALIEADPDIIILPSWAVDDFCSMEPYSSLSAVVNGNIVPVDSNIFDRQGARNIEAVTVVADAVAAYAEAEAAA